MSSLKFPKLAIILVTDLNVFKIPVSLSKQGFYELIAGYNASVRLYFVSGIFYLFSCMCVCVCLGMNMLYVCGGQITTSVANQFFIICEVGSLLFTTE